MTSNFKFQIINSQNRGFTLIEVILVVIILGILATISISDFILFKKKSDLNNSVQEFTGILKFAQNKALSSENDSQYGVYLDATVSPSKYVLFKGASFALRDASFNNQTYFLANTVEFFGISLGGGSEVVFNKLTGTAMQSGSVSLRLASNASQTKTVYISSSGTVSFNLLNPSDANRAKDSRHLHFDYSRSINTANENIKLTFNGNVDQIIPIAAYLTGGQINWQGTVNAGGANQTVRIHTHKLNNPDTRFSIHRDKRLNDKSLVITISGDGSGNLAQYSADGLTTTYSSIYVSNFVWQ